MRRELFFYHALTTLLEPVVLAVAGLVEPPDDALRRERRGHLTPVPGGLWLHAASAGEMRGLLPLTARLEPGRPFVVTAHTAAGRAAALAERPGSSIHRMPFDLPRVMRRAFDTSRVAAVVLAETELWPNLLEEAGHRGVPVALVNARLSDRSWPRYRASRSFWRPRLGALAAVAAQSDVDAERFRFLGVPGPAVAVTGNMKHDRGVPRAAPVAHPWGDGPIVSLGSLRPGEETSLATAMAALGRQHPGLRVVVAPRHRHGDRAAGAAFQRAGFTVGERSRGGPDRHDTALLLDTMGELNAFYAASRAAFVGGTLRPYGGHNVAEPALVGTPVVFGPHTDNCRLEADTLVALGGGRRAATLEALVAAFTDLLGPGHAAAVAGSHAAVAALAGATDRTVHVLAAGGIPGLRG